VVVTLLKKLWRLGAITILDYINVKNFIHAHYT